MIKFEQIPIGGKFRYILNAGGTTNTYPDAVKTSATEWKVNSLDAAAITNWYGKERHITFIDKPLTKEKPMLKAASDFFSDIRGYIKDNRDWIYTILLVILLDHYLFNGALRERLKRLIEGVIDRAEMTLNPHTINVTAEKVE